MLKEQQAAFQLVVRAGGSEELMHRCVTVNNSSEAWDVQGYSFICFWSVICGSNFTSAQKSALLFSSTKTAKEISP